MKIRLRELLALTLMINVFSPSTEACLFIKDWVRLQGQCETDDGKYVMEYKETMRSGGCGIFTYEEYSPNVTIKVTVKVTNKNNWLESYFYDDRLTAQDFNDRRNSNFPADRITSKLEDLEDNRIELRFTNHTTGSQKVFVGTCRF